MENSLFAKNTIKIVGHLVSAEIKTGNRKDNGAGFITVNAIVQSNIEGKTNEYEVSFSASQMTKDGKVSQLYTSYSKMKELEGRKVQIDGDMRENRYWSTRLNQLVSGQTLNGKFVKGVVESTPDEATFEMGGFVLAQPVEKTNKSNEIYRYDVKLGQANWRGDNMNVFVLHVRPEDRAIIEGVKTYNVGDTVRLTGTLNFIVETITKEVNNEGGFGAPIVKTFTNRQKNFWITGGSAAIKDETAYPAATVRALVAAYKAKDVELESNGKSKSAAAPAAEAEPAEAPVSFRQASLI